LSCRHAVTCLPCGRNLARCPLCRDKLVSEPKRIVIPETNSAAVVRPYHLPPPGQPQISPIRSAMEYQAWPDVVLPFGIDPADRRLYPSWVSTQREREFYRRTDTFINHWVNADAPGRLHYQHTGVVTTPHNIQLEDSTRDFDDYTESLFSLQSLSLEPPPSPPEVFWGYACLSASSRRQLTPSNLQGFSPHDRWLIAHVALTQEVRQACPICHTEVLTIALNCGYLVSCDYWHDELCSKVKSCPYCRAPISYVDYLEPLRVKLPVLHS